MLTDKFKVKGTATLTVKYFVNGTDFTSAITAGTFRTATLDASDYMIVEIRVTVPANAAITAKRTVVLKATSVAWATQVDVVRAVVSRR